MSDRDTSEMSPKVAAAFVLLVCCAVACLILGSVPGLLGVGLLGVLLADTYTHIRARGPGVSIEANNFVHSDPDGDGDSG